MSATKRPRFDLDALRERAGEKTFARGEAYHRDDRVEIVLLEPQRVLAQVAGSEDYRTTLTGRGKAFGGDCDCPAFAEMGFCKHMVAVALAANAAAEDGREGESVATLARMRRHLKNRGVDALVELVLELAEQDRNLFRRLELASASAETDGGALEARLRKAIDEATRTRGYVEYHAAPGWAKGVATVLDALAELASGPQAARALAPAEHAIERIEAAIETIDDSDGHCGGLLELAREIHLVAARAAKPDPVAFARNLFAREMADGYGVFAGSASLYADVLGGPGLDEYRRLATEAWAKLPARVGDRGAPDGSDNYRQLRDILDRFAEREGDVAARIALRAKDLSSTWAYWELAQFCLSQGREEEALRWAEDGLFVFADERPDERLTFFAVDLLSKSGRKGEAEAHLWRAFDKAPSFELYARLSKLAGVAARQRAIESLQARAAKGERTRWQYPADLLLRVLTHEKMFDAAWAAVKTYGASIGAREALARASEATHAHEALEVYAERVEALAGGGGNPAYAEATTLIARMAGLRGAAEQQAYLAGVKARFGRKRNFMALLG
jgi:uncharacterized Zn finger protein